VRPDLNVRVAVRVGARDVDAWETDYRIRHDAHRSRNLRGAKRRHRSTDSTNPAELRCARHGTQDPIVAKHRLIVTISSNILCRSLGSVCRRLTARAVPDCTSRLAFGRAQSQEMCKACRSKPVVRPSNRVRALCRVRRTDIAERAVWRTFLTRFVDRCSGLWRDDGWDQARLQRRRVVSTLNSGLWFGSHTVTQNGQRS
jgi:hypothetical protein